jgi:hypothetical protein
MIDTINFCLICKKPIIESDNFMELTTYKTFNLHLKPCFEKFEPLLITELREQNIAVIDSSENKHLV